MNSESAPQTDSELAWRKSSYSSGEGGECVEVAAAGAEGVRVRDSKRVAQQGPELRIGPTAWAALLRGL